MPSRWSTLRTGRVSRTELVEAAIGRVTTLNPTLNGLAHRPSNKHWPGLLGFRGAGLGVLRRVPTLVKDDTDLEGHPTADRYRRLAPKPKAQPRPVRRVLLATGLIPVGKTQMSEFGFSGSAEHPRIGAVRNPWDTDYTAGRHRQAPARSSPPVRCRWPAAATAAALSVFPQPATDWWASKPSRGRLPLDGPARQLPVRIVTNGVLSRSVRDTAAFYREAERIYRDRRLPAVGAVTGPGRDRLRVAVTTRSVKRDASPEVRDLTLQSAALLESLGHHVEHLDETPFPRPFR